MFNRVLFAALLVWAGSAPFAAAQSWAMVETEGTGGAGAFICADATAEAADPPCFRVTCEGDTPLHYEIALFGAASQTLAEEIAVEVRVDNRGAGLLLFEAEAPADGMANLTAPFDPRLHRALIAALRKGNRAELVIQNPAGAVVAPVSLRGSSKTLGAVMETCPMPEVPLNDPAAVVLDEVVRQCGALGGSVAMEPGFERREDLDGDGEDDVVIDYAAAVCSEMASLYCGSGGCTVGFFLARGEAYERIFDGVIRGYSVQPGGLLALDLHGTACGLYGFEACRKVFRISDDSFALVDELAGDAAEAAQAADRAVAEGAGDVASSGETAVPEAESGDPEPSAADGATDDVAPTPEPEASADGAMTPDPDSEDTAAAEVGTAQEPVAEMRDDAAEAAGSALDPDSGGVSGTEVPEGSEPVAEDAATPAEAPVAEAVPAPDAEPDAGQEAPALDADETPTPAIGQDATPAPVADAPAVTLRVPEEVDAPDAAAVAPRPDPAPETGMAEPPVEGEGQANARARPAPVAAPADAPAQAAERSMAPARDPAPDAPDAPPSGLEWMGDGGSVFIPAQGESLPDDLDPDVPELAEPAPGE